MLSGSELGSGVRLATTVLTASKLRVTECCPSCMQALDRLTLTVGEAWAEVEECAACGMLVLDDGELDRLRHLVAMVGDVKNAEAGLVKGGTDAAHAHARAAREHAEAIGKPNPLPNPVLDAVFELFDLLFR